MSAMNERTGIGTGGCRPTLEGRGRHGETSYSGNGQETGGGTRCRLSKATPAGTRGSGRNEQAPPQPLSLDPPLLTNVLLARRMPVNLAVLYSWLWLQIWAFGRHRQVTDVRRRACRFLTGGEGQVGNVGFDLRLLFPGESSSQRSPLASFYP